MIRRILNLVFRSNKNPEAAKANMTVVETLEGRLFMSVAPSAVAVPAAASASTIAADRAGIQAKIRQIKADALAVRTEIASARKHFLAVTLPADEPAIRSAELKYERDKAAGTTIGGPGLHPIAGTFTPQYVFVIRPPLVADRAAIVTARMQLKADRAALLSTIKLDLANGKAAHIADESALKALEAKLKTESK